MKVKDVEKLHYISNETINKLLKKGFLKENYEDKCWSEGDYLLTLPNFIRKNKEEDDDDYNKDGFRYIYIVPEYSENPKNFTFWLDEKENYSGRLKNGDFENKGIYIWLYSKDLESGFRYHDTFCYWEFEEFWKPYLKDNNFKRIKI